MINENEEQVDITEEPSANSNDNIEPSTAPAETDAETISEQEKQVPETVKEEKKEFTDLEKAQYSFHKQFSKQKKKYEEELAKRDNDYKALQDRLERLENPEKYREKYRSDFKTDDEYINHLVQTRLETMLKERDEADAKSKAEAEEKARIEKDETERINNNIRECFKTDEAIRDYQEKVSAAFEMGLEGLIDGTPALSNYIQRSVNGPKILMKLATDQNSVKSIFEGAVDDYDIAYRVRDLEKQILADEQKAQQVAEVQNNNEPVKKESIGTPGKSVSNNKTSVFDSDKALRDFMRS